MSKKNITMLPVEAYSLPSSYGIKDSSHTFIVAKNDRTIQWTNGGGGWGDSRPKTLVSSTTLYYEWANTFIPRPTGYSHGGIRFGVNGVCHTIANRVLAVANSGADVKKAEKDEYSVVFYGKYGLGLKEFKEKLTESFHETRQAYDLPDSALTGVLSRVDDFLTDELMAWKSIAESVGGIDVDDIVRRSGGVDIAKRRLSSYIDSREALFDQYLRHQVTENGLRQGMKRSIQQHAGNYLDFLHNLNLISQAQCALFHARLDAFLNRFIQGTEAQIAALQNGCLL